VPNDPASPRCAGEAEGHPIEILIGLVAVVLLIALNGICVAGEFSLVAVDPGRVELRAREGGRSARITQGLLRRISFHLAGAQLGITVTSVVLGLIAEDTIGDALREVPGLSEFDGATAAVAAILVATVLQMLFGELIPKNVAISKPLGVSLALAPFLRIYGAVAGPVIGGFNGLANTVVRLFGMEPIEEIKSVRSLDEIAYVVRASSEQGTIADGEVQLLNRTIRLRGKNAADALIPRTAMASLSADASVAELVQLAADTGHSRFPVTGESIDDILGVADVRDVFTLAAADRASTAVRELVRPVVAVPETRELDEVLLDLHGARSRLALVVDEHGGTEGIITLEDILEELVGDISDEYDEPVALTVVRRGESYVLEGGLHPDEVSDIVALSIPDGPYETLAGFVLQQFGHIPEVGERVEWEDWTFEVTARDRLRVAEVAVTPPPAISDSDLSLAPNEGDRS
jgi:CBS domain containing-hemolysin-like protein